MKRTLTRVLAFALVLALSLSAIATALADYDTIPYGERSNRVRKMQNALKTKGYYGGSVDGKFGPSTKAAVKKFQNAVGISADGRPGNTTLTALYEGKSAINKTNDTKLKQQTTPENPNTLYYGCTGDRVKSLQRALKKAGCYGGSIDGVYGDLTLAAVKRYQNKAGLHADGLAGTKTLNSLRRNTGVGISYGFTLDVGSTGSEVKSVARRLSRMGYTFDSHGDTYTESMAEAVKAWQTSKGYEATGAITQSQYNALVLADEK